jgi:hypothetical protein
MCDTAIRTFEFFSNSECPDSQLFILLRSTIKTKNYRDSDSLWRRQSQQSFNTLTPFNFLFYSLHVSAPTGHPQVRYTISYYFCFLKDYFNTTDPLHICNLIIRMLFVVISFWTYSPNTCYGIKYKNKNWKISKIPRY